MKKQTKILVYLAILLLILIALIITFSSKEADVKLEKEKEIKIEEKIDSATESGIDLDFEGEGQSNKDITEMSKDDKKAASIPTELQILLSKKMIKAENGDTVYFSTKILDQYDNEMMIEDKERIEIYVNNNKITGESFSTDKPGQYSVFAKYGNLYSGQSGFVVKRTKLFKDMVLESEIRKLIGKPSGKLQEKDLQELPVLTLENKGIKSIEGIQYLKSLQEIKLTGNKITNIDSMKNLKKVERLWLDDNKIKDVSALSEYKKIKYLELGGNQISDIRPLSTLFSLKKLYLYDNGLRDVRPLVNLTGLVELGIWDNELDKSSENIFNYLKKKSCEIYQ